jgi:uncharacterized membrane protein
MLLTVSNEIEIQGLAKSRVEALSDGIFAVAMTLLILDIKVPSVARASDLPHELLALWPRLLSYVISFLMLGIYWVGQHNQFHIIRRADRNLLWINVVFLLTICLVPFSTALVSAYLRAPVALAVYGGNLIAIGLILCGHWLYATHRHRLTDRGLDPQFVRLVTRRILIGPVVFGAATTLAFVSTTIALVIFVLGPAVYFLPGKIDRHWNARREA